MFQGTDRLTGVGDDGQIIYQHARLMAAAQRLEVDLLMAMPPHEREARFRSARFEAVLAGEPRRTALAAIGMDAQATNLRVLVLRLSERSKEARLKKGEYTWSFMPEADLADLQDITVAQFKGRHPGLAARNPVQNWEYRKKLRDNLTATILEIDRGACILVVEANNLLTDALHLNLLRMDIDGTQGRFGILDPTVMDVFTGKLKKALSDQTGIRHPPVAQNRPLFPAPGVARVRPGRARGAQADGPAAEFIWNADVMSAAESGVAAAPILAIAERIAPGLTDRQSQAIRTGTERRLSLWWGPPGTGKSRTAQAYVTALASDAVRSDQPLRIAIAGFT